MYLLKRNNWWSWLLFALGSSNVSVFFLGALLNVYEKNSWYAKWYFWILGIVFFLLPALIMFLVFYIQTLTKICKKLEVPGSEIYCLPYFWIICFIIPIIGWVFLTVLTIYLHIMYLFKLYQGKGERYIEV